jgi:branched-subunit amino acid transport protein
MTPAAPPDLVYSLVAIAGLIAITVITRSFFFISERSWQLPRWVERGLAYAPIAALAAVIAPELLMSQGQWSASWQDARIYGAAAGAAWFFWRRGVLGTIVCGMAVFLPLRLMLGW